MRRHVVSRRIHVDLWRRHGVSTRRSERSKRPPVHSTPKAHPLTTIGEHCDRLVGQSRGLFVNHVRTKTRLQEERARWRSHRALCLSHWSTYGTRSETTRFPPPIVYRRSVMTSPVFRPDTA